MEHLKQETVSGAQLNMDALYQICPQCFTESKDPKTGEIKHAVDFEKLRLLLGDNVAEGDERYDFTWVGKRAALQEAAKPIRKTLRPCPEESVDWENTKNLYIEGDNLEVLKLLQNSYMGKVKMIYIDPPYNTGNDFVYQDDFHQTKKDFDLFSGDVNEEGERLVKNTESNGRFHSDWCSMVYSRLMLARTLLTDDGVIFISIDNCEYENLTKICNEIFGESNFVDCITWNTRIPKNDNKGLGNIHQYLLVYVKNHENDRQFTMQKDGLDDVFDFLEKLKKQGVPIPEAEDELKKFYNKKGYDRGITLYNALDANYQPWGKINMSWPNSDTFGPTYDVIHPATQKPTKVPDRGWRWNLSTFNSHLDYEHTIHRYDGSYVCGDIWFGKDENTQPSSIKYLKDVGKMLLRTVISLKSDGGMEVEGLFGGKSIFSNPKPTSLLRVLLNSINDNDFYILDFFSGSATTAHAVMQLNAEDGGNRKYIMVQLPESTDEKSEAYKAGYKTICEIGKERIRRAGKKIMEEQKAKQGDLFSGDQKPLDVGFRVFKCADSNMKDVYYTPADYDQQMLFDLEDNVKEDRNDLDLLFGCMLDWGVTLDLPLRSEKVNGVTIHVVNEGDLVACFDQNIPESAIDHIASLLPMRVVLRDSCFKEAKEKMNFFEIFKQRTGWSEEEVRKNVKVI